MTWLNLKPLELAEDNVAIVREFTMPPVNEFFLVLVVGAFGFFAVALAYASAVAGGSK